MLKATTLLLLAVPVIVWGIILMNEEE